MGVLLLIIWIFAGVHINHGYDNANKVSDHGAGEWMYHALYFVRVLAWPIMSLDKWPDYSEQVFNHIKGLFGK